MLQEHWLADGQLDSLNELSDSHCATAVSGFGCKEILRGRPYGGCAIFLVKKNIDAHVDIFDVSIRNRICALHVYTKTDFSLDLLFVSVYMPFESNDVAYDEFCSVLMQIAHLAQSYPDSQLILGGDFNVDLGRSSLHTDFLKNYCTLNVVQPVINHQLSKVDYTYNFSMQRFSVIDHFIF